jgi:4-amino-4-deoxy-L-arabinose transferase-like glycosyltransferase
MSSNDGRLARNTVLTVLALVALRLVAAAWTPLTFDEAYYWMWSKHLAGGYYDHPPMVAFVIRSGIMIAGDTEFGVRLVSILLALPMSFAVYRTAAILFGGSRVAATATILLNVTMMAAVGTLIVTPDAPLLVASSFVLFFLAKVLETGRGAWWLAVGAAVGAALLSKYTALFFGLAILIWLVSVPGQRRWLISPWPYLGGLVALAIFAPVILWNADHQWVSFIMVGSARIDDFGFIAELKPTICLATPLVSFWARWTYALAGATPAHWPRDADQHDVLTIVAYFIWHSPYPAEANWLAPDPALRRRSRRPSHAMGRARAAPADFCLRGAPSGADVRVVDRRPILAC